MNLDKKISMAVIRLYPGTTDTFLIFEAWDNKDIFKGIKFQDGITASQIRQDLNCFGGFGQQGTDTMSSICIRK